VGDHIRPRVRAPESWNLPVGLSLSAEVGYQQRQFSTDTWTLELRPIIDKQWGPWYVSVNPVFGMSIKGENSGQGFGFSPAAKVSYSVTPKVALGSSTTPRWGPSSTSTGGATSSSRSSPSSTSTSAPGGSATSAWASG